MVCCHLLCLCVSKRAHDVTAIPFKHRTISASFLLSHSLARSIDRQLATPVLCAYRFSIYISLYGHSNINSLVFIFFTQINYHIKIKATNKSEPNHNTTQQRAVRPSQMKWNENTWARLIAIIFHLHPIAQMWSHRKISHSHTVGDSMIYKYNLSLEQNFRSNNTFLRQINEATDWAI